MTLWATVLLFLKLLGVAPVQWIALLPFLNNVHFADYFGILLNFFFAILGALGVESLVVRAVKPARALAVVLSGTVLLFTLRQVAEARHALEHEHAARWLADWKSLSVVMFLAASVILVGSLARSRLKAGRVVALLLTGIFIFEGFGHTAYPRQRRWDVWRHPVPYVEKLMAEARLGRVYSGRGSFHANMSSAFEVFGFDSVMTFNPPRMYQLYQEYAGPRKPLFMRESQTIPP